jgi:hypothetical protein
LTRLKTAPLAPTPRAIERIATAVTIGRRIRVRRPKRRSLIQESIARGPYQPLRVAEASGFSRETLEISDE